jgi:hypothetical protein
VYYDDLQPRPVYCAPDHIDIDPETGSSFYEGLILYRKVANDSTEDELLTRENALRRREEQFERESGALEASKIQLETERAQLGSAFAKLASDQEKLQKDRKEFEAELAEARSVEQRHSKHLAEADSRPEATSNLSDEEALHSILRLLRERPSIRKVVSRHLESSKLTSQRSLSGTLPQRSPDHVTKSIRDPFLPCTDSSQGLGGSRPKEQQQDSKDVQRGLPHSSSTGSLKRHLSPEVLSPGKTGESPVRKKSVRFDPTARAQKKLPTTTGPSWKDPAFFQPSTTRPATGAVASRPIEESTDRALPDLRRSGSAFSLADYSSPTQSSLARQAAPRNVGHEAAQSSRLKKSTSSATLRRPKPASTSVTTEKSKAPVHGSGISTNAIAATLGRKFKIPFKKPTLKTPKRSEDTRMKNGSTDGKGEKDSVDSDQDMQD